MPRYLNFTVTALVRGLEERLLLAEALFFPEVSRLGHSRDRVVSGLHESVREIVKTVDPLRFHHRRSPVVVEVASVSVTLPPSPDNPAWRRPLMLRFDVVHYTSAAEVPMFVAYVPELEIEIVGSAREAVEAQLDAEIMAELMRRRATLSLAPMVWLQRSGSLEIVRNEISLTVPTLKEKASEAYRAGEDKKNSVLASVGTELSKLKMPEHFSLDVTRLAQSLKSRVGPSVVLVGASGVGKSAMIYELVRTRLSHGFGSTSFWETSGARIMAGGSGFGGWQQRCMEMWTEASTLRGILVLGNLVELMQVGRHETSPQGIAGFLRTFIARGDVPVIVECTPEQQTFIEREDAPLLQLFRTINVEAPSTDGVVTILMQAADQMTQKTATTADPSAIRMIVRLHDRFATYSAPPGRPLRFLRNHLADAIDSCQSHVTPTDVTAAFAAETGLPRFLIDESMPLDVEAARAWFTARLMGQEEPVSRVVDALTTVKASLTRPHRPIASFLFIGPTGVGKTEMARCLAEYLFSDRSRMVRFDMSEFSDATAVQRLIGPASGRPSRGPVRHLPARRSAHVRGRVARLRATVY